MLDRRVDERGFLHLSTLEPYVYHMGNQVDEIAQQEEIQIDLNSHTVRSQSRRNVTGRWLAIVAWLARSRFLRGFFTKLYHRLFQIYSP